MKYMSAGLIVAAAALSLTAAAADIRADMAAFDRAYIPVYALTSEGAWEQARKAVRVALRAWVEFRDSYYNAKTTDAAWRSDLDRVHALFYDANALLDGRQPELALEPLKRVRAIMMNLRQRNGIAYYLDDLVAFSEPMESIVLTATRGEATGDSIAKVRALLPAAQQAWTRAAEAEPGGAFALTAAQREELYRRRDAETAALDALKKALASNERAAIASAAAGIKPPFDRLYYFFGDFHGLMWVELPPAKQ